MASPEISSYSKFENPTKVVRNVGVGIAIIGAVAGIPSFVVFGLSGAVVGQGAWEVMKRSSKSR